MGPVSPMKATVMMGVSGGARSRSTTAGRRSWIELAGNPGPCRRRTGPPRGRDGCRGPPARGLTSRWEQPDRLEEVETKRLLEQQSL